MPNLNDIKKRVKSIKNTQQITKAMKMVAAAKLRRAQERIQEARAYTNKMAEVMASLALRTSPNLHPLLEIREPKKATVIVLTSDRGLCGSFNASVLKMAENYLKDNQDKYDEFSITAMSRKANDYFKRRDYKILHYYENVLSSADLSYQNAMEISTTVIDKFLAGELDEVYIAFTKFKSAIAQEVVLERILPLTPMKVEEGAPVVEYIFEPTAKELLDELLKRHIVTQILGAMLDSIASEHGARMTAMDSATNNASDMIKKLTLLYNRARQASITTELVEIVSGAEALKD